MLGDMPDMITGAQATDEAVRDNDDGEPGAAKIEVQIDRDLAELDRSLVEDRSRWFLEKGLLARSAIVFAGPLFNFILAAVLVFVSVLFFGEEYAREEAVIGRISSGSPAASAGIEPGDRVLTLDGATVDSWEMLATTIREGSGSPIELTFERNGEEHLVDVQPLPQQVPTAAGSYRQVFMIGISPEYARRDASLGRAASIAALWTWRATERTVVGLWGLVSGAVSPKELAGPLFILSEANRQAERGLEDLLSFMAVLSISLAVLNLLPVPVLDGGHLLFFLIEALLGPISIRKREFAQQIGVVLLLCLMIFAVYNDIFRDRQSIDQALDWEQGSTKQPNPKQSEEGTP
ncbi:MAG: RIP metalloprotease RseP, partial [Bdellovibrionales bacterium]|nr:RIP metalloprotease RseP [Bdellovibrionales bacterium]